MSVVKGKEEDTGHTYYALVSAVVEMVNVRVLVLLLRKPYGVHVDLLYPWLQVNIAPDAASKLANDFSPA